MSMRRFLVLLAILFFVLAAIALGRAARENARAKTLKPIGAVPELQIDRFTAVRNGGRNVNGVVMRHALRECEGWLL